MKHIGNEIDRIIKKKGLKTKDLADTLGITRVYLSQIKKKSSIDCELLDKIAIALGEDISIFFDNAPGEVINATSSIINKNVIASSIDNRQYYSDSPDVLRAQVELLEERIKEKDSQIKEKDSQIKEKDSQIKELLKILANRS